MSSMRPPMLAGPIPRNTNRLSIGSSDQLIGVGVGLGEGVAAGVPVGVAVGVAVGVCTEPGSSGNADSLSAAGNVPGLPCACAGPAIVAIAIKQVATISAART